MDDPGGGGTGASSSAGSSAALAEDGGSQSLSTTPVSPKPGTSFGGQSTNNKKNNFASNKQLETYYQMFSPSQHFDKFFIISSADPKKNLTEINTILANKQLIKKIGGNPENIKELRSGGILVETRTPEQSKRILELTQLGGCNVTVKSNDTLNQCKGTIYYKNGPNFTEAEIQEAINETCDVKVAEVYRMKKKVDDMLIQMPIYLITFQSTDMPSYVKIGWTRCSTRQYVPRPRRCFNCQEFGHSIKTCRNPKTCVQCGERNTNESEHPHPCDAQAGCSNCGGSHPASSRDCPRYETETNILKIQTEGRLSYSAARRRILGDPRKSQPEHPNKRYPNPQTYSATVAKNNNAETQNNLEIISPSPIIKTKPLTKPFQSTTFNNLSLKQDIMNKSDSSITVQKKRHLSNPTSPARKHTNKEKNNSNHNNKSYENQTSKPNSTIKSLHENDKNKNRKKSKEQKS